MICGWKDSLVGQREALGLGLPFSKRDKTLGLAVEDKLPL